MPGGCEAGTKDERGKLLASQMVTLIFEPLCDKAQYTATLLTGPA